MKALIIYDDISSAFKAINSLRSADSSAGSQTSWNIKLWRLGLMRFPSMAGEALREASDADLILCAVRQTQAIPSWIRHWFERWAAHRKVVDAGVALIIDDGFDLGRVYLTSEMADFAAAHNLTFIASDGREPKAERLLSYRLKPIRDSMIAPIGFNA
jgi:hypothetical protein